MALTRPPQKKQQKVSPIYYFLYKCLYIKVSRTYYRLLTNVELHINVY